MTPVDRCQHADFTTAGAVLMRCLWPALAHRDVRARTEPEGDYTGLIYDHIFIEPAAGEKP